MTPADGADAETRRLVKLQLPLHVLLRLHRMKIEEGHPISEVVEKALHDYFRRNPRT